MAKILTLTGQSGVGKTTIARAVLFAKPDARMVTSYTTRDRRLSDLDGEYKYVSDEEFASMESRGMFLWTAEHDGKQYGTTARSIHAVCIESHIIGIMILVPEVIEKLRKYLASIGMLSAHTPLFVVSPQKEVLLSRLLARGDIRASIDRRLEQAGSWEMQARTLDVQFRFVRNDGPIGEVVSEVLSAV